MDSIIITVIGTLDADRNPRAPTSQHNAEWWRSGRKLVRPCSWEAGLRAQFGAFRHASGCMCSARVMDKQEMHFAGEAAGIDGAASQLAF